IGDADRNMLAMISEHGEGKLYMAENASELPKIFVKETSEVQKSSLVEDLVTVHVVKRVEMIEGTGVDASPPLRGYVTTKPKDTAAGAGGGGGGGGAARGGCPPAGGGGGGGSWRGPARGRPAGPGGGSPGGGTPSSGRRWCARRCATASTRATTCAPRSSRGAPASSSTPSGPTTGS